MAIKTKDALPELTNRVIAVANETVRPKGFIRSLFKDTTSTTRYVSSEVRRGTEKIAADIIRGSEGNKNSISRSSQKTFDPNYYNEYFDMAELDIYDRALGADTISVSMFSQLRDAAAEKVIDVRSKIERAYELQGAQVLQTGVIQSDVGTSIDYKRKAASMVDLGSSNYWDSNGVDPKDSILTGCEFLRSVGKARGGVFNMILGSKALAKLLSNETFQAESDIRSFSLNEVREPQRNSVGAVSHGYITVGSWIVRLWTYPEFYTDSNGDQVPYIEDENAIILPEAPEFVMGYAAVPQLIGEVTRMQERKYLIQRFVDERKSTDEMHIKSAALAVPVMVDQIYTMQVLGS